MSTPTHSTLKVQQRTQLGNIGKKLRRQGLLPAVIYGFNIKAPINISMPYNDFEKVYRNSGSTSVVDIDIDGKKVHTLVQDLQFHPVKDTYIHVDFLAVNMKKVVEAEVPLVFTGVPVPVKQDGAILNKTLEYVLVSALPDSIPHEIEVDLGLIKELSDVIHVSDLKVGSGVEIITDPEDVIASVQFAAEETPDVTPETIVGTPATEEATPAKE
jgi:large subunit ribosomal protein L25